MSGFNYCINCGYKVSPTDNFCLNCGAKLVMEETPVNPERYYSDYKNQLQSLKEEYDSKIVKATELIKKHFSPSESSYDNFISTINNSNNIFYNNYEIALEIIDLATTNSLKIEEELKNKIKLLDSIIDKIDDLISELVIHLSNNKRNTDEINSLTEELDDLIDSVKKY